MHYVHSKVILPVDPVSFSGLPAMGIYPNVQGLVVQAVTLLLITGIFAYSYYAARETT
jgi:hypothetical protein